MFKNDKNNKDIYEVFNDISFDEESQPIEMDELEIERMKRRIRDKIKTEEMKKGIYNDIPIIVKEKKKNVKWLRIASFVTVIILILGVIPSGREVLAQIANKLFFTPSQGIMEEEQWGEVYILEEPVRVDINGESALIKNVINSGDYIHIEMWIDKINEEDSQKLNEKYEDIIDKKVQELKENLKLKTTNGKVLPVEGYVMTNSGYTGISFNKGSDLITEFELYYGESEIDHFSLNKVNYVDGYDDLGGNVTNNGILIGANSYYVEGERYFSLWSNMDNLEFSEFRVNVDNYNDIIVTDDEGSPLKFEIANDGTGKSYKLLENYNGNIHINISNIDLSYNLRESTIIPLKLPKKGETYELNKEIKLKGLKDRIVIRSIIGNDGEYENGDYVITLDYSHNYDSNRFIYMASVVTRSCGAMGDPENKYSEIYLDNKDLSFSEKLLGILKLKLDNILVRQYGNWEFIIR